MPKLHLLTLEALTQESPDAITLHFAQPAFGRIHYKPGQYLTLKVPIAGLDHYRSYSLCSAPRLDEQLSVTVKRVPGGLVSNYLHEHVQVGQQIEAMEPRGRFLVENATKNQRHLVLFGGGSGITPLMSILRSTLITEPLSRVSLWYASTDQEACIFYEKLAQLQENFAERFWLQHHFSARQGRFKPEDMKALWQALPATDLDTEYYLCGPTGLMAIWQAGLEATGIDAARIHRERFVADRAEQAARASIDGPSRTVRVRLGEEIFRIQVPPGNTVMSAALSQGIRLPFSCLQGICATCMGHLNSGKVEMEREEALLDFEREKGMVLVCQAHPLSDDVQIEMG